MLERTGQWGNYHDAFGAARSKLVLSESHTEINVNPYGVRMHAKLRVPASLQASTDVGGPARAEWLATLPDRVEELTARWRLDLDEPFEPGGNCSWVAAGTDADGREVVLKVAWHHTEALHEAEGLAAVGGRGAVEVYAFEPWCRTDQEVDLSRTPPRCCSSGVVPGRSCADAPRPNSTSSSPICSGRCGPSTCRPITHSVRCP